MYVVGLTGGIGSGKTAVSNLFAQVGIDIVDCDVVSRQITASGGCAIEKIRESFGAVSIASDGSMDRKYICNLVFKDAEKRELLQSILYPIIQEQCEGLLSQSTSKYTILSVPLMKPNSYWSEVSNRILVVDTPRQLQIERVMKRSGLSAEEVSRIIDSQMTRSERIAMADDVILNAGNMKNLQNYVQKLSQKYLDLAKI